MRRETCCAERRIPQSDRVRELNHIACVILGICNAVPGERGGDYTGNGDTLYANISRLSENSLVPGSYRDGNELQFIAFSSPPSG
jgi:hypothetical protein